MNLATSVLISATLALLVLLAVYWATGGKR